MNEVSEPLPNTHMQCGPKEEHGEVLLMPVGVPAEGVDDAIV